MQSHPFDILQLETGAFIFTPCPGTKSVGLSQSVADLKAAGAKAIITLMYDEELVKNGAQQLATECEQADLSWFQLPIIDDDAPSEAFNQAFSKHLNDILAIIKNGGSVAVHCKGGSGRTGLVIGLLMHELGYAKNDIVNQVQAIRPKSLQNPIQRSFFDNFQKVGA
ncbi:MULTISPECIES: dual specificity protein phosphatase family protein [unclassified Pseudoalteromonas]|mgnify:FL=1|uniref:phosphatase domain-containing putative toxin n=1 Tax=unclassified Pseudoalteromonas TaxID=194690 RepID=UPI001F3E212E|nr:MULTISPECIES: dual specificity protein phosphatase family protein [unclassified Pseudoalteromonas]MCF2901104.1 dual specificity protein phosphatase family protein [Pseudoalteromonas sp. OFAV1]MCO7251701.1 dual specificity protein phosphatase family protein [Pseudoalteromonas sp. Ps84H-4]